MEDNGSEETQSTYFASNNPFPFVFSGKKKKELMSEAQGNHRGL